MLGSDVAKIRVRLGMTHAELARCMGINSRTIHRWETDEAAPAGVSLLVLGAIVAALELGDRELISVRLRLGGLGIVVRDALLAPRAGADG